MGRVAAWEVATRVAIDRFPFGAGFYAPQLPVIFNYYLPNEGARAAHSIYFQVLGEQGFIGLALFLMILLFALRNAGVIRRQVRDNPELLWASDLANMIRVALIGFYIGGAALSMAYFDGLFLLMALLSTLRELTAPKPLSDPSPMRVGAPAAPSSFIPDPVPRAERGLFRIPGGGV